MGGGRAENIPYLKLEKKQSGYSTQGIFMVLIILAFSTINVPGNVVYGVVDNMVPYFPPAHLIFQLLF